MRVSVDFAASSPPVYLDRKDPCPRGSSPDRSAVRHGAGAAPQLQVAQDPNQLGAFHDGAGTGHSLPAVRAQFEGWSSRMGILVTLLLMLGRRRANDRNAEASGTVWTISRWTCSVMRTAASARAIWLS